MVERRDEDRPGFDSCLAEERPAIASHAVQTETASPSDTESSIPHHPLIELTVVRIREFVREPEALFWVFVFPVLLAFALGIAFRNTAPEKTLVAVVDGPSAGAIAAALEASSHFKVLVLSADDALKQLRTGKVANGVKSSGGINVVGAGEHDGFPVGIGRGGDATGSSEPVLEYFHDPSRAESRAARLEVNDALQRAFGRKDLLSSSDTNITEPGARYIDFLIPGLIGLNLMGSGMWGVGFVVVQSRTQKLLKRLAATPMRRSHFLLSFMLSRLTFLILEVGVIMAFGWMVFGVPVRGSLLSLSLLAMLGAMTFAGLGLLVAARCKTMEGVSGWMNLIMLPMWLLSGTFFSAARFPDIFQPFIKALPLTSLNDALRAVINDGLPLHSSWLEIGILMVWGCASFVIALRIFRWQ